MKKIFFIHVAKTAGSAFNDFLRQSYTGVDHCESYLTLDGKFLELDYLKSLDFISGHLKLSVFHDNGFLKKDYFLLAFLREPISHLISHLNWVMNIKDLGLDFFNSHPDNIKSMCLQLRKADLYDPEVLFENLNEFAWLFQNYQSKYFVRNDNEISTEIVISNMMELDMVGITEQYEESLSRFIQLNGLHIKPKTEIVNKHFNRLKLDLLNNKKVLNFLLNYLTIDLEVYKFFVTPEISRFYGIIITINRANILHHINIKYGEYLAVMELKNLNIIEGSLPKKCRQLVREWTELHQEELIEIWDTQKFHVITPLE